MNPTQLLRKAISFIKFFRSKNSLINILLATYSLLIFLYLSISVRNYTLTQNSTYIHIIIISLILLSLLSYTWFIYIKYEKSKPASLLLIILLLIPPVGISIRWGPLFPQSILGFALVISVTNALLGKASGIRITFLVSLLIIIITHLHTTNQLPYETGWLENFIDKKYFYDINDAIVASVTLICIHLIAYYTTKQKDHAILALKLSEKMLLTERDNLELRVYERTKELESMQKQKLEEINNFTSFGRISSGIIHELVTPLQSIDLRLDYLAKNTSGINSKKINDTKQMIDDLINDVKGMECVVDAARKQFQVQRKITNFNIAEELSNVERILTYKLRKDQITLSKKIQTNQILYGDSIKFNQFMSNIIINAIQACALNNIQKKIIELTTLIESDTLIIKVKDNGIGIKNEIIDKIYEPLFTTKNPTDGTGLGLYITKKIIEEDFKGTIHCYSTYKKGTTFIIKIPISTTHE